MEKRVFFDSNSDLSTVPSLAREALDKYCSKVVYYESGFTSIDRCNSCESQQKPGWYADITYVTPGIYVEPGLYICDLNGNPAKKPEWWN